MSVNKTLHCLTYRSLLQLLKKCDSCLNGFIVCGQILWTLVSDPAHEAVSRLLVYSSPGAPGGLLGLQRPLPVVDQLVAVAHSVSRHYVHLRRVPLHALRAQGHPAQHGAQGRPISSATTPIQ